MRQVSTKVGKDGAFCQHMEFILDFRVTQGKAAFAQALVTGSLSISASLNFEVMGASSKAGYAVTRLLFAEIKVRLSLEGSFEGSIERQLRCA